MTEREDKYLGYSFCVGSSHNSADGFLLLGLLLFDLPTSFLFLNLLHSLLRGRSFHHISPYRNRGSWRTGRSRFLATGLNLRSWKTPRSGRRDWGVFCWCVGISDCGSSTLTFKYSLPRLGLFGFGFLNFAEPDGNTRGPLPIIILGPNSLDRRRMNGDQRSHLRFVG